MRSAAGIGPAACARRAVGSVTADQPDAAGLGETEFGLNHQRVLGVESAQVKVAIAADVVLMLGPFRIARAMFSADRSATALAPASLQPKRISVSDRNVS